jgi:type IV fimbrial biogenesis protein FimT
MPLKMKTDIARSEGFTLIELMVVLVIVAVILTVAMPGFSTLNQRIKLKSYTNEFIASVILARSEAIKRNTQMDVCIVLDPNNPVACGSGGDWEEGWLVKDPNGPVIRYQQGFASGIQLFNISSSAFSKLSFDALGAGFSAPKFKLCQADGVEVKQISVSATGRTRVETCPSPACACDSSACDTTTCDG